MKTCIAICQLVAGEKSGLGCPHLGSPSINLVVGQSSQVDLVLPVGATQQVVTVEETSGPVTLSTQSSSGLVNERRAGNRILYRIDADRLALTVSDFISAVCPAQINLRRRGGRSPR